VGVVIARLGDKPADTHFLFRNDSDIPLIPASNLKLVTTAAAMDKLGADFKFRTMLALRTREDGQQDLVLWGDGDPTLGDAEMLRKVGWGTTTVFDNWAEQLKKRGIMRVRNVLIDDSVFDTDFVHKNWPNNQLHLRYCAGVGGLNLNANALDFMIRIGAWGETVSYGTDPATRYVNVRNSCVRGSENAIWLTRTLGTNEITLGGQTNASSGAPVSVTIHDPSMFAGTVFAESIMKAGIAVTGEVERDRQDMAAYIAADENARKAWTFVAAHETPMTMVLARTNKDSMNMYAESLLKRLGHAATQQPGSWANGTAAAGDYLKKIGVTEDQFSLDDGCGLSKENRISANALAAVLITNFHSPTRDTYLQSLAIADMDGTFANRFSGTDLRGRVFGKSGYVAGVSSFSGYLKAKDNQWYVFSIIMNNVRSGNAIMKEMQERIVKAVDAHTENLASGG
jgi:serine-type D-Ala-D-Ala carboxypeptidase/endopeptidase (penicillin-binding protein 4)